MTGNDIDAYLQPLIKELKELCFDGVYTFNYSEKKCLHCERLYGQLVTSWWLFYGKCIMLSEVIICP